VRFRLTSWRAAFLLAFFALLFGIPAASVSSAATSNGWIRLGNLSPTTSPVDVYLYSASDSSPQLVLRDIAYGTVSAYDPVGAGDYTVKMLPAGAAASAQPVVSASVTVQAGHSYTVVTLTVANQGRQAQVLDDSLTTPTGKSLVRVIQASINQKGVTFHCSCASGAAGDITSNAPSGSVSSYAPIPAGTWTMAATGPTAKSSLPVTLVAGTVHTEVVIDTPGGISIENLLDAAGSGQPPVGGVETGFGGTAAHGPGSPLPWLAAIVAGALLALGAGLRLRRSKGVRQLATKIYRM
jgi:hypothetical protein